MRASTGFALAAINLAAVIFGSTALFGRLDVSPVWIVVVRGAFAALAIGAIALARRAPLLLPSGLLGGVAFAGGLLVVHWVTFFFSVQLANVAVATLTFATFPLWTVAVAAARKRRAPQAVELAACAAIILAVLLIVQFDRASANGLAIGVIAGLASAVSFAVFGLFSQHLIRICNMATLSLWQNLSVCLLLSPLLPFTGPAPDAAGDWLALAALGAIATALAHQLYFFALSWLPAAACGSFVALEPVYAIVMAAMLFGDPLTWRALLSGALIVGASIVLLQSAPKTHPASPPD